MAEVVGERSPNDPRPATARPVGTVDRVVADDGSVEVWQITRRVGRPEPNRLDRLRGQLAWLKANRDSVKEPYPGHTDDIIETLENDIQKLTRK